MLNDLCNNLYDTWAYLMVIREQYTNTKTAGVIWTFIRVRTCGACVPRLDELWGQHLNRSKRRTVSLEGSALCTFPSI